MDTPMTDRDAAAGTDPVVRATEDLVRERLGGDTSGHDWFHTDRVRRLALRLAREEEAAGATLDRRVIELAALLHDLEDWKFAGGDETAAPRAAAAWLTECGIHPETIARVAEIVGTLSFKGAAVPTPMATLEGAIVQDADRLDAIGAIGIARTFAYGGSRGHPLLVDRSLWGDIPDEGLRAHEPLLVPCDDLGAPGDVDYPDELPERFRSAPDEPM